MISLAALGMCAALGMNLLVQFGLGLGLLAAEDGNGREDGGPGDTDRVNGPEPGEPSPLGPPVLCAALFLLWLLFSFILSPLRTGWYWYLLLYPLSTALMRGLEWLLNRSGVRRLCPRLGLPGSFPSGWTELLPLGLLISLHLALGPLEALVLSLGFSLGLQGSLAILREIRRRSRFEAVPPFLRGNPLALISLGLLSMICMAASLILFNIFNLS
jgi:Na+-translocating ferredoxin:NAD+ oxidoreductase RnfA subunit